MYMRIGKFNVQIENFHFPPVDSENINIFGLFPASLALLSSVKTFLPGSVND